MPEVRIFSVNPPTQKDIEEMAEKGYVFKKQEGYYSVWEPATSLTQARSVVVTTKASVPSVVYTTPDGEKKEIKTTSVAEAAKLSTELLKSGKAIATTIVEAPTELKGEISGKATTTVTYIPTQTGVKVIIPSTTGYYEAVTTKEVVKETEKKPSEKTIVEAGESLKNLNKSTQAQQSLQGMITSTTLPKQISITQQISGGEIKPSEDVKPLLSNVPLIGGAIQSTFSWARKPEEIPQTESQLKLSGMSETDFFIKRGEEFLKGAAYGLITLPESFISTTKTIVELPFKPTETVENIKLSFEQFGEGLRERPEFTLSSVGTRAIATYAISKAVGKGVEKIKTKIEAPEVEKRLQVVAKEPSEAFVKQVEEGKGIVYTKGTYEVTSPQLQKKGIEIQTTSQSLSEYQTIEKDLTKTKGAIEIKALVKSPLGEKTETRIGTIEALTKSSEQIREGMETSGIFSTAYKSTLAKTTQEAPKIEIAGVETGKFRYTQLPETAGVQTSKGVYAVKGLGIEASKGVEITKESLATTRDFTKVYILATEELKKASDIIEKPSIQTQAIRTQAAFGVKGISDIVKQAGKEIALSEYTSISSQLASQQISDISKTIAIATAFQKPKETLETTQKEISPVLKEETIIKKEGIETKAQQLSQIEKVAVSLQGKAYEITPTKKEISSTTQLEKTSLAETTKQLEKTDIITKGKTLETPTLLNEIKTQAKQKNIESPLLLQKEISSTTQKQEAKIKTTSHNLSLIRNTGTIQKPPIELPFKFSIKQPKQRNEKEFRVEKEIKYKKTETREKIRVSPIMGSISMAFFGKATTPKATREIKKVAAWFVPSEELLSKKGGKLYGLLPSLRLSQIKKKKY